MVDERIVADGGHLMLVASGFAETPEPAWFDPVAWRNAGAVAIETSGRGVVLIAPHGADTWVLRHYRRGGLIARVIDDHYLWLGAARTRAFREWRILNKLRAAGLPVPSPVAAHVRRNGALYTADLITAYLPDTRKLSWFIERRSVPADAWRRIGALVGAVHAHGVDHPDLTAHNLLLDGAGRPFLVDFDNAREKAPGRWQREGVDRLARSLRKVALETGTPFYGAGWDELAAGYAQARAGGWPARDSRS